MDKAYTLLEAVPGKGYVIVGDRRGEIQFHPAKLLKEYPQDYESAVVAEHDGVRIPVLSDLSCSIGRPRDITFEAVAETIETVMRPRGLDGSPNILPFRDGDGWLWLENRFAWAPKAKRWVAFRPLLTGTTRWFTTDGPEAA